MSETTANRLVLILSLVGGAIALWLLKIHVDLSLGGGSLESNCSILGASQGGAGCEVIALSQFSKIAFLPLAGIALGYYVAQLVLSFWSGLSADSQSEPLYVSYNLASVAVLVSLALALISTFVVQSFCIGCAGLWLVNLALWFCRWKSLRVPFAQILRANFAAFEPAVSRLDKSRVRSAFLTAIVLILGVSGFSAIFEQSQKQQMGVSSDALRATNRFREAPQVFLAPEAVADDRAKGAATNDAVLTVVKFADFQCPACKRAAQMFKPFFLRNKAKVRFVYRNFPLDGACNPFVPNGGHFVACNAALATICAGKQSKFYEFHDQVFDRQESLSPAVLDTIAANLNLDMEKFSACRSSQEAKEELTRDMNWGESAGLNSTPTFIVNGRRLEGTLAPDEWEAILLAVEQEKSR